MKKMFTQKISVFKLSVLTGIVAGSLLLAGSSYGQGYTYYSRFSDPTGHYSKTDPMGCSAPAIDNIAGIADDDAGSYASIKSDTITQSYNCSSRYLFDADLNMGGTVNASPAGSKAGFRISVSSPISANDLGNYLTVTTYLRDSLNPSNISFQEYATSGNSSGVALLGIDIDATGKNWLVYFISTKPFNILELAVNPKIIPLNTDYQFNVYFAFGGATEQVLPAQIANFKALIAGNNVNLSWQSLTETNVSNYRIERSNGNGAYTSVATIPAKGNSNAALSYAYTDKSLTDGNYLYRVVTVNRDGTSKTTSSLSAAISGQGKLLLYPTLVKAGQSVTVKTTETGLVSVYMFDAQGRMVKQQRTTSGGQFSLSTGGLSIGVYNVKVVSGSGAVLQSKIVVN